LDKTFVTSISTTFEPAKYHENNHFSTIWLSHLSPCICQAFRKTQFFPDFRCAGTLKGKIPTWLVYTFESAGKLNEIGQVPLSWWHVSMAVVPCFSCQVSPLDHSYTFTRRLLAIVVGVTVLLSTNYYQAYILNGMMVQDVPAPYTVQELADKLYSNELRAVLWAPA
jgi:hypothetical protein